MKDIFRILVYRNVFIFLERYIQTPGITELFLYFRKGIFRTLAKRNFLIFRERYLQNTGITELSYISEKSYIQNTVIFETRSIFRTLVYSERLNNGTFLYFGKCIFRTQEPATGGVLQAKVFLETLQNSQRNTCARVYFLIKLHASGCNFIKQGALALVFSCKFCEIFRNTFFTEHLRATASGTLTYLELEAYSES